MKSSFDTSKDSNVYDYSHSDESTNTSCSIISANCIEYDSDIESDDSIHFYTHSTEFVDNGYLRINHKPFLQLWRKQQELEQNDNKNNSEEKETENTKNNTIPSISQLINKNIFKKINELNNEIEKEYNLLESNLLSKSNKNTKKE